MNLKGIKNKWEQNKEDYKEHEIGSGVHSFVQDCFESSELFNLPEVVKQTNSLIKTFTHEIEKGGKGRPDFVIYINEEVIIPVECKKYTHINEGEQQLKRYQIDSEKGYRKQYGILTDGYEWRLYRARSYKLFTLDDMLNKPQEFLNYWHEYIKKETYYLELFTPRGQSDLIEDVLKLVTDNDRKIFFTDITKLISSFSNKMKLLAIDLFNTTEEKNIEISYSYLIQFILYKVLVDNNFKKFQDEYDNTFRKVKKAIQDEDLYNLIINEIVKIADYISTEVYKPFKDEQQKMTQKLTKDLKRQLEIDDISHWLDILWFINKYNFANLKNEIFGFVYENYLKDLYGDKDYGQFFTSPDIVNFMLDEVGYTKENLSKEKCSLIDNSCGAGTFLYSAVDRIIESFAPKNDIEIAKQMKEIVNENIFGLDVAEFPLYLAEMSILMRLLPFIVNDNYENPIENKLKLFKTNDSISEFLDVGIGASKELNDDLLTSKGLGYTSFMRDNNNLKELFESVQLDKEGKRKRYDFAVGNPPYIGYNDCCVQKMKFTLDIKNKKLKLNNIYGINLHSVPNRPKKYAPKPNLYAFFTALSIALLKNNGKLCYIIPQTLLTTNDLDVMRYYLAQNVTIEKIITFENPLFINRSLAQNKIIATSSLIIVIKKDIPTAEHKVKIINYGTYKIDKKATLKKQKEEFKKYIKGKNKKVEILQSELFSKYDNWNFIKQEKKFINFINIYKNNSSSIEEYRQKDLKDYNEICLDCGLELEQQNITTRKIDNAWHVFNQEINDYKKYNLTDTNLFYSKNSKVSFMQASQGFRAFNNKYKIIWKTRFNNIFQFSEMEELILNNNSSLIISSNNSSELLFLLALLNSKISLFILENMLKLPNESKYLVALTSIKKYIRIPNITKGNEIIKAKIIKQTEIMLDLEKILLKDLVNFNGIMVQKFDSIKVKENNLILSFNGTDYKCEIENSKKSNFINKLIQETYYKNGILMQPINLYELQELSAIDFDEQAEIKDYIDDLVFALYFTIDLKGDEMEYQFKDKVKAKCRESEFYDLLTT